MTGVQTCALPICFPVTILLVVSQNTSESKSENKGANTSKSETTSTGGTRNVVVWPKYDEKGNLEHLYMVILNGDYKNISMEFRQD